MTGTAVLSQDARTSRGRVGSWLMIGSGAWCTVVLLRLVSLGRSASLIDGVVVGSDSAVPWPLVGLALVAMAGSLVAAVLLGRGAWAEARVVLALVVVTGWLGWLSSLLALTCLWIVRRRR